MTNESLKLSKIPSRFSFHLFSAPHFQFLTIDHCFQFLLCERMLDKNRHLTVTFVFVFTMAKNIFRILWKSRN